MASSVEYIILLFTDQRSSTRDKPTETISKVANHFAYVEKYLIQEGLKEKARVIKTIGDSMMIRVNCGASDNFTKITLDLLAALCKAQRDLAKIDSPSSRVQIRIILHLCKDPIEKSILEGVFSDVRKCKLKIPEKNFIVSLHPDDIFGRSVVLGARIEQLAKYDQILMSGELYDALVKDIYVRKSQLGQNGTGMGTIDGWMVSFDTEGLKIARKPDDIDLIFVHPPAVFEQLKGFENQPKRVFEILPSLKKIKVREGLLSTSQSFKGFTVVVFDRTVDLDFKCDYFKKKDIINSWILIGKDEKDRKDKKQKIVIFWGSLEFDNFYKSLTKITREPIGQTTYTNFIFKQYLPPIRSTYLLPTMDTCCILVLLQTNTFQQSKYFADMHTRSLFLSSKWNKNEQVRNSGCALLRYGILFGEWDNYLLFSINNQNQTSAAMEAIRTTLNKCKDYARGEAGWNVKRGNIQFYSFIIRYLDSVKWQYWSGSVTKSSLGI